MEGAGGNGFRADIEGLRALAVGLVVAFHAGIPGLAGGFVGVDVFFVLSGFLITRLLIDERRRSGTVSLPAFWSRRARRLLPAASLTLVVTLVAAQFVLPALQRRSVTIDGLFSAVFLANVRFAESLGDYFGNQLAQTYPSPFLHYWSLAAEEQFYVVWPVIVLLATRRGRRPGRSLALVASLLAIASFAVGVWWTPRRPEAAFYLLPSRMWELLAGGILAIIGSASFSRVPAGARALLGWLGIGGIAVASSTFSESMAFPGYAALLPVLATVALVVAGSGTQAALGPGLLLERRALQWIGGMSYAIYLWHWPVLVLFQARNPEGIWLQRTVAVAVSIGLAYLSTRLVENPIRFARVLVAPASRGLLLGAGLLTCSIGAVGVVWASQPVIEGAEVAAVVTLEPPPPATFDESVTTTDAPASDPALPSAPPDSVVPRLEALESSMQVILDEAANTTGVPSNLRPALVDASRDLAAVYREGCMSLNDDPEVRDCRYGQRDGATKVVLFGDSHAAHWFPALDSITSTHGAELIVILKGGCPVAEVPSTRPDLIASCPQWRDDAIERVIDIRPTVVIVSSLAGYTDDEDLWRTGLTAVLERLRPATDRLVVVLDTPRHSVSPPVCLSEQLDRADACVSSRVDVIRLDRAEAERAAAASAGAEVIDPIPWLCGRDVCPVIVGDVLMYRDADHMTTAASSLLAPLLEAALLPWSAPSGSAARTEPSAPRTVGSGSS